MQWLIDIVKQWVINQAYATEAWVTARDYATRAWVWAQEYVTKPWILSQNYLTRSYVDRGDANNFDWRTESFITDGSWHELDLSGIIPFNTKAVAFHLYLMDDAVSSNILFRTKGNTRSYNIASQRTQAAQVYIAANFIVAPNLGRKIEYQCSDTVFSTIWLSVKGWWL